MLSSPLLVTWQRNSLALGPRLNALLETVVIRVLNQVAHVYQSTCKLEIDKNQSIWLCQDRIIPSLGGRGMKKSSFPTEAI